MKKKSKARPITSISVKVPKAFSESKELTVRLTEAVNYETKRLIDEKVKQMAGTMSRKLAKEILEANRPRIEATLKKAILGRVDNTIADIMKNLYIDIDF